jgi:hypothetical protein
LRLIRILLSEAKITWKYKKEEKVFPSVVWRGVRIKLGVIKGSSWNSEGFGETTKHLFLQELGQVRKFHRNSPILVGTGKKIYRTKHPEFWGIFDEFSKISKIWWNFARETKVWSNFCQILVLPIRPRFDRHFSK